MSDRFTGKVVVITGAAGGIGQAAAVRFASEGAHVVAVDVDPSQLDATMDLVKEAGSDGLPVRADVTKSEDVERYVADAVAHFGGVDYLFNNAGIEGVVSPLIDYPEEMFRKVLDVNVVGVFLGMQFAGPAMRERGGGVIVNTASVAGLGGTPNLIAYGASKHAVIGMTKSAAIELAPDGTRVNAICPSPIETRMMRSIERGMNPDDPESVHEAAATGIPLGRYGEPEEVAALVAFLCSDDAAFISGGIYPIDGGSRAR
jgi:NAD(P)-dependent dehydrogenase (short-subunit alcohol dehydrogenase family)